MLDPAGPHAATIEELWWLMVLICGVVFVALLAAFLYALWRGRRGGASERGAHVAVIAAVAVSTAGLLFLIFASAATDRSLQDISGEKPLEIRLTAAQWFWEALYQDPVPARTFTTANEIHIPVGRPVSIELRSRDVIHSFWVPSLAGKKDLIPGRTGTLLLQADKPGTYRGQCAEYCGHQHAKMALLVIAHPAEEFEAWADAQRQPAPPPANEAQRRGHDVFMKGTCATCHAISGTPAYGRLGPDLSHLASRRTLAAGQLPNTRGHLAGWIVDPQSIKPGVRMPSNPLPPQDLQALLEYLGSLK